MWGFKNYGLLFLPLLLFGLKKGNFKEFNIQVQSTFEDGKEIKKDSIIWGGASSIILIILCYFLKI